MPEMDGIESTEIIRALEGERFKTMPIIALTANAVSGMKEMFLEKGFNDFLAKPIDVSKLDEMITRWIPIEKQKKKTEIKKELIFLVDDNPTNLRLGINALQEKYNIITAPSAKKMFDLLETNNPAMILLDVDMPQMDGYEADKILKAKPETKGIPVIFITEFDPANLVSSVENHFNGIKQ